MLPGCSASTSPSFRRDIHAGCHLPTGVKVRTESQPLVRSSVSARSIMSSPRSGTLPYRTTSASNCTPLPASTVFMAWSIAPCTDASAVASSGGRAIVWMPALAAARRTFGQSLETTTSVSAREPRAWSNVYSITARPSSGSMCLFAKPRLPARARMTPSAFIKSPLRPMPFVAALTHGEAQPLPGAMVLPDRAEPIAPDLGNRRAADFAEGLLARHVLLAGNDSAVGQDRHARAEPTARPAARGRHVGDGDVGYLCAARAGGSDDGRAEGADPLVVPLLHVREIGRAFCERRHDQRRAAAEALALEEKDADVVQHAHVCIDAHHRGVRLLRKRGDVHRDDVDRHPREVLDDGFGREQVGLDVNRRDPEVRCGDNDLEDVGREQRI